MSVVEVISSDARVVEVVEATPAVVEVAIGQRGPRGLAGDSVAFQHTQSVASASWVITVPEAFTRRPAVTVWVAGEVVDADIAIAGSTVTIIFATPVSGYAVLT